MSNDNHVTSFLFIIPTVDLYYVKQTHYYTLIYCYAAVNIITTVFYLSSYIYDYNCFHVITHCGVVAEILLTSY